MRAGGWEELIKIMKWEKSEKEKNKNPETSNSIH